MDPFFIKMLMRKRGIVTSLMTIGVAGALYQYLSVDKLALVGVGCIAIFLGDCLAKFVFNLVPRGFISDFSDKAVLITGCDSGFGSKLVEKLDGQGFQVFAGCLNIDCHGAQELKRKCSDRLHLLQLDVTKSVQITTAVRSVESLLENRKLWAVVNNAGVACSSEIEWCPMEVYKQRLNVNTLGVVEVTKSFLPLLKESQGRIIIVASLAGRVVIPGFTPYSMSKYAVVSFADGLRREMTKWNIGVHTIEPSLYRTNISLVEPLYKRLSEYWNACSDVVKTSYGLEYYDDFKSKLADHMMNARPENKIQEVVDDLVDAVAGSEPMLRYVPAMDMQIRSRSLCSMPVEMQDHVLAKYSPQVLPAAVVKRNNRLN